MVLGIGGGGMTAFIYIYTRVYIVNFFTVSTGSTKGSLQIVPARPFGQSERPKWREGGAMPVSTDQRKERRS